MKVHLSTDGSFSKKKGGWAYVIRTCGITIENSGAEYTKRGINHFELVAIIQGLMQIAPGSDITIYTDSSHVIHHASKPGDYYLFRDSKLWKLFAQLKRIHTNIEFVKVGSNRYHEDHRRAHQLAKEAIHALDSEIRNEGFSPVNV